MSKKNQSLKNIIEKIKKQNLFIIGVCGIPGAGKSTICEKLLKNLDDSLIIPMDGFHLYRKQLDQQGIKRRGAPFTFNLSLFKQKLLMLKQKKQYPLYFPSFNHEQKDPKQNTIIVNQSIKHVLVQGLYIFDKCLQLNNLWDMKIFIDQSIKECTPRLIKRCIQKNIQTQQEKVQKRIQSDIKNAEWVLQNSDFENCIFIQNKKEINQEENKSF